MLVYVSEEDLVGDERLMVKSERIFLEYVIFFIAMFWLLSSTFVDVSLIVSLMDYYREPFALLLPESSSTKVTFCRVIARTINEMQPNEAHLSIISLTRSNLINSEPHFQSSFFSTVHPDNLRW